jgi:putative MATE family efflux protein
MSLLKRIIAITKQSLNGAEHDYTKGSMRSAIVLLAIPMILELSLESVFAVVDMYFVGHLPNAKNAIATVGLTESVMTLVYTMGIGLSIGATAIVARRIGEKNPEAASFAGAQAILVSFFVGVVLCAVGVFFSGDILRVLGAKPEVIRDGKTFTTIMMCSSPAIVLLFLINGIFRGAGDATMAMRSLWIASGINIVLCPLLIYGLGPFHGLGLMGAALATVIGRTTGVVYQCYYLAKKGRTIQLLKSYFKWNTPIIQSILKVATPATLQFFIQSGSWVILTYLVSKTGSTEASAGYQIAIRNVVFFILPAWGISNAAATLVGQNLGAQQIDRAEKSVMLTSQYNMAFMAFVTILFVFFSRFIIGLFTKEEVVLQYGSEALRIIGFGYIFYGIGMVMIQALNGAGDTKTPTWINLICFWFFQVPLAWYLSTQTNLKTTGVFIAIPVAESLLAVLAWYYFKKGKWKTVKV